MGCFLSKISLIFVVVLLFSVLMVEPAFAAKGSGVGKLLCTMAGWFTGNAGKGIAMVAVFILGTGALLGKVTWSTAAIIGTGVAVLFGGDALLISLGYINCHATFT